MHKLSYVIRTYVHWGLGYSGDWTCAYLFTFPLVSLAQVTLLKYFRSYMSEHLLKAGGTAGERPVEEGVRLPHLRAWFRTRSAIVLHLSNGIMQVCVCVHACMHACICTYICARDIHSDLPQ